MAAHAFGRQPGEDLCNIRVHWGVVPDPVDPLLYLYVPGEIDWAKNLLGIRDLMEEIIDNINIHGIGAVQKVSLEFAPHSRTEIFRPVLLDSVGITWRGCRQRTLEEIVADKNRGMVLDTIPSEIWIGNAVDLLGHASGNDFTAAVVAA